MPITREQLLAEAPDLANALRAEGAAAERERIQTVESALIPGHEALIASLKFDGKTSGGDAALQVNAAERAARERQANAMASDAPQPLRQVPAKAVEAKPEAVDENLPLEQRCEAKWTADASLRAEFGSLAAFTAYERATESGRVRVLRKGA